MSSCIRECEFCKTKYQPGVEGGSKCSTCVNFRFWCQNCWAGVEHDVDPNKGCNAKRCYSSKCGECGKRILGENSDECTKEVCKTQLKEGKNLLSCIFKTLPDQTEVKEEKIETFEELPSYKRRRVVTRLRLEISKHPDLTTKASLTVLLDRAIECFKKI